MNKTNIIFCSPKTFFFSFPSSNLCLRNKCFEQQDARDSGYLTRRSGTGLNAWKAWTSRPKHGTFRLVFPFFFFTPTCIFKLDQVQDATAVNKSIKSVASKWPTVETFLRRSKSLPGTKLTYEKRELSFYKTNRWVSSIITYTLPK